MPPPPCPDRVTDWRVRRLLPDSVCRIPRPCYGYGVRSSLWYRLPVTGPDWPRLAALLAACGAIAYAARRSRRCQSRVVQPFSVSEYLIGDPFAGSGVNPLTITPGDLAEKLAFGRCELCPLSKFDVNSAVGLPGDLHTP